MSFFIVFIVWYNFFGKSNPKIYRSLQDKIGKIFGVLILFSIISSMSFKFLIGSMVALLILGVACAPFVLLYKILKKIFFPDNKRSNEDYIYNKNASSDTNTYNEQNYNKSGKGMSVTGLTKSVPKRKKIVKKFNDKKGLNLTEAEMDRIVDASYISYYWEKEIFDMDSDYDSIYEWYRGETGWLRAYLRVFNVQTVSSDFGMQRKICIDSYDQIFREVNPGEFATIDECVDAINNKFLASFDETTFMIAYRFLEANGRNYELPSSGIIRNESELERLQRKYDEAQKEKSSPYKTKQKI